MKFLFVLLALCAVALAQRGNNNQQEQNSQFVNNGVNLPCGFSCTRRAQFQTFMDGQLTSAQCSSSGVDSLSRCNGCCGARALAAGISTEFASGFASVNNNECVCCTFRRC
ncbi:unnamed protein product [Auanema sp. JU1783]|nr:unnamed protein product [Auanema sp. JU1783]